MEINHAEILNSPDLGDVQLFADEVKGYLKKDYAVVIGVTGGVGTGKSTLSCWLSYLLNPYEFALEKNMALKPTTDAFIKQFEDLPAYSGLVGDEGAWYAFNRNFMSSFQIYLMQYLKTFRKNHNKAVILCMTSIHKFDKDLRSGDVMHYWIHILNRGNAVVFESTKNIFSNDGFRIGENEKLFEKWRNKRFESEIENDDMLDYLEKTTNYVTTIKFPDMPKDWKKRYMEMTIETKQWYEEYRKSLEKSASVKGEKRYESMLRAIYLLHHGDELIQGRSFEDLGNILNVSANTLCAWEKEAVQLFEKEQKLK